MEALGTSDFIAEVGEQLSWLGAALRFSPRSAGVVRCTPYIKATEPTGPGADFSIQFALDNGNEDTPFATTGQCWHALFGNPVVVEGYPILRRPMRGTGLEIPLNMMSSLAKAPRVHNFLGRLSLKGFSTLLVPVERVDDTVLWHLYYREDGSRIPYFECGGEINECRLTLSQLMTTRHILGWCSEARYQAGMCINAVWFIIRRHF